MSRKEQILKAATMLFAHKGYAETSMAELSELTEVATSTIFYHFTNKEKLFLSILEDVRNAITREFENHFNGRKFDSGLAMVEEVISFYLDLASKLEFEFMLIQRSHTYKLAEVNPECRNHLEAIYNRLVDIFEQTIIRGQKDGSIVSVPVRKTALIVFSMVDGFVRLKNNHFYDVGALFNELVKLCQRMLENRTVEPGPCHPH